MSCSSSKDPVLIQVVVCKFYRGAHKLCSDKTGLAEALNKLGLTYCDIGYDLRAIDYFEQASVWIILFCPDFRFLFADNYIVNK